MLQMISLKLTSLEWEALVSPLFFLSHSRVLILFLFTLDLELILKI